MSFSRTDCRRTLCVCVVCTQTNENMLQLCPMLAAISMISPSCRPHRIKSDKSVVLGRFTSGNGRAKPSEETFGRSRSRQRNRLVNDDDDNVSRRRRPTSGRGGALVPDAGTTEFMGWPPGEHGSNRYTMSVLWVRSIQHTQRRNSSSINLSTHTMRCTQFRRTDSFAFRD